MWPEIAALLLMRRCAEVLLGASLFRTWKFYSPENILFESWHLCPDSKSRETELKIYQFNYTYVRQFKIRNYEYMYIYITLWF